MGTCCSASPMSEKFESIDTMRLEQWYLGNDYFDQITFNRNIQQDENHCFQRVLRQVWKDKAMQTSLPPRNAKPKYSSEIREEFHYLIQKGVPNYLIREVILQLIPFDDDFARNNYGEILECLEPLPDFMNLPPTLDPLFGRKELQNVFLTSVGMIGCKRVLFALKSTIEDVKICMLLPRVTQLLLWFMREHEVFQVVQVLVNESKIRQNCEKHSYFFPFSLEKQKQVATAIAGLAGVKKNKYLVVMVKDMVYNFMVGYISPSFLPIVMMYFIVDGIGGMLRLLVPLIKIVAPYIEPLTLSVSSTAEFLIEAKQISKDNFDITMMMKVFIIQSAFKVSLEVDCDSPSVNSDNDLLNYTPIFDGASRILENKEEIQVLCSHVPKKFLEHNIALRFSIHKTGFDSQKFLEAYEKITGPSVLLIETYKKRTVGVFLDRSLEEMTDVEASDSCLFVLRPEPCVYRQFSNSISASINLQSGFVLYDNTQTVFSVCAGLSTAISLDSKAFQSPQLSKSSDFLIFDLELFELL